MASVFPQQGGVQEVVPKAIYGEDGPIKLSIATGGAGQTGVLKALADSFITLYRHFPLRARLLIMTVSKLPQTWSRFGSHG